jgi:signal peptidase I
MSSRLDQACLMIIVILLMMAIIILLLPHFGYRIDVVYSGSMEPAISTGDLVITGPVAADGIRVGDVITFATPKGFICHRVVAITGAPPEQIVTKGDANRSPDQNPVAPGNVAGKLLFTIPLAGYLVNFVQTLPGLLLTILAPGLLIVGMELKAMYFGDKRE